MKKFLILVLVAFLIYLTGCAKSENTFDNYRKTTESNDQNVESASDEEKFYEKLYDEYDDVGNIVDGIVWVKKEDYSGIQCGYLKTTGEWVIPLTPDIKIPHDFYKGFAVAEFEENVFNNNWSGIYDSNGNLLVSFQLYSATRWRVLNNGNIYFVDISMVKDSTESEEIRTYMFCSKTGSFREMPVPAKNTVERIDYSDGLLSIWCEFYKSPGTKYFDELGNCVIDVDSSSEYYKTVLYAGDFENGKAEIQFYGMDNNLYSVHINKKGEWVEEPKKISESEQEYY